MRDREGGCTVLLTGLSGSGKSTIARALQAALLARGVRDVVLLDGDELRRRISPDLGFTPDDRDEHLRRVGRLAVEITRRNGVAICALIAPREEARRLMKQAVEHVGRFVLVHVATPLDVCERRDPRGWYAQARSGAIARFTGISDPYEVPVEPDLSIDTTVVPIREVVEAVIARLGDDSCTQGGTAPRDR